MGVYNSKMKMPSSCMDCPFLIYRHYDMPDGNIWLKTCPYEPEDKQGETEKYLYSRARWCVLEERG